MKGKKPVLKFCFAAVLLALLCGLTGCGNVEKPINETTAETARQTEHISETSEQPISPETDGETAIQNPVETAYNTMEALADADGILSVKIVDHSTPGIDVSTLPTAAAEQYRALLEDCTVWEIRYEVDSAEVVAYAAAPNTYLDGPCTLILYNRGGNGSFGAMVPQSAASIAYLSNAVVIAPNYGDDDEFGGSDVAKVTFWLDLIPALPFVNPEEVFLLGESRGGMQGCLTLLEDDNHIIKAAALVSGIYDLPALYEYRPDMQDMLERRIGGSPADCPEEYENRSAVTFADQINTPLLLIHSTGDKKTPYAGAEAFAKALDENGKTYRLVTRENAAHGLSAGEMADVLIWLRENAK